MIGQVFPEFTFSAGAMLEVWRTSGFDEDGPGTFAYSHLIGPCAEDQGAPSVNENRQERTKGSVQITAPADSDVTALDRIKLPDGHMCTIDEPKVPVNPFTGWAPLMTMTLTRVG